MHLAEQCALRAIYPQTVYIRMRFNDCALINRPCVILNMVRALCALEELPMQVMQQALKEC